MLNLFHHKALECFYVMLSLHCSLQTTVRQKMKSWSLNIMVWIQPRGCGHDIFILHTTMPTKLQIYSVLLY